MIGVASKDQALRPDVASRMTAAVQVVRWRHGACAADDDHVAVEAPLEIRLATPARAAEPVSITMRTPGDDGALAVGFLVSEGVIRDATDIIALDVGGPASDAVTVTVATHVADAFEGLKRNFAQTSSCGVCGKRTIADLALDRASVVASEATADPAWLAALPDALRTHQPAFDTTGGLHGVGLFRLDGGLIASAEDVGRHNALDKLIGASFLAGALPWRDHALVLSGRASFELIQKATVAGVPFVVAVGAPSSLAVRVAERAGVTLIGFTRADRFNIYSHAARIRETPHGGGR